MDSSQIIKKLNLINSDPFFSFDDASHTYRYAWKKLKGVTSLIHDNFVEPFDEEGMSKKVAEREGVTQEEILEKWRTKSKASTDLGSFVHDFIENFIKDPNYPMPANGPEGSFGIMLRWVAWFVSELRPSREELIPEIRIHWGGFAGTLDDPFWSKKLGGVVVNDWKTYEKWTGDGDFAYNMLKYPFHNFKNCKHNIASIQISIYRLMLEEHGIPTVGGMITHLPREGSPKAYVAKDFRPQLRKFLDATK